MIQKDLAFTISKLNFTTYNTPLYNIPSIKTSIFFNTSFKYSFFIIFYSFLFFLSLSLTLSPLCLSFTTQHRRPPYPPTHFTTTTSTHHRRNHKQQQRGEKKSSTSKATKSKNHPNQRITKSQQRPKTIPINPHAAPKATPINPRTQPPKSRTHQNQSKSLKLELTDIKSQNPLTKPPQRPTMNHLETHDPRKTTAAQPHLASHPDHTQDP